MLGRLIFVILFFSGLGSEAQSLFSIDNTVPIEYSGQILNNGFGGGLNSAQYQQMDLNNDGVEDLVVYERSAKRLLTFVAKDNAFEYQPRYEQFFPDKVDHWIVLADYNCDGKKDLFTSSLFGMSLYQNVSAGDDPQWQLIYETIFTEGSSGQINLQVNAQDYPGIQDVDDDGDLDILVYDFASGGGIEFHENKSVDNGGSCGLELVRVSRRYGNFEECSCELYVFGDDRCPEGGRLQHSGGKSILSYDFSGDSVQDLVIGQEYCTLCGYLVNSGTLDSATYASVNFDFPTAENPLSLNYPAVFVADMDFDGNKDLIASPNSFENDGSIDFQNSNWLYLAGEGGYTLSEKNMFQGQMIDVGLRAVANSGDIDKDGDADLFIGAGDNSTGAAIWLFENTGTIAQPAFKFVSDDVLGLRDSQFEAIGVQMIDMNGDGWVDLVADIQASSNVETRVYWHTQNVLQPFDQGDFNVISLPSRNSFDQLQFFDVNSDKLPELFIGRTEGGLSYYKNVGSLLNPVWELISDSFLGLGDNFQARNLHLSIGDMNNDQLWDMVTYDDSKTLRVYYNFLNDPQVEENIIVDPITQNTYSAEFGILSYPAIAPLYGSSAPSILLALYSGGLNVVSNIAVDTGPVDVPINLSVFPNPVGNGSLLNVLANQNVNLSVIDAKGKVLAEEIFVPKGVTTEIGLSFLRAGVYIIRTQNEVGEQLSRQVMVVH